MSRQSLVPVLGFLALFLFGMNFSIFLNRYVKPLPAFACRFIVPEHVAHERVVVHRLEHRLQREAERVRREAETARVELRALEHELKHRPRHRRQHSADGECHRQHRILLHRY